MDRVAIALATYNGEKYIREQLESLLNQTYQHIRCYIHDDGSTDRTTEIVDSFCAQHPDRFVRLNYSAQGGSSQNFMSLLAQNQGGEPYIMLCDQDDVWQRDKVQKSLDRIKDLESANGEDMPALVFCDLKVVDAGLQMISDSFFSYQGVSPERVSLRDLFLQNCAPGCTMIINKSLKDAAIRIPDLEQIYMHDVWLMLIASYAGHISCINEPLIQYRQHANNAVGAERRTIRSIIRRISLKTYRNTTESLRRKRNNIIQLSMIGLEGLSYEDQSFVQEIAQIDRSNKIERMMYYYRNRLYRYNGIMTILCC